MTEPEATETTETAEEFLNEPMEKVKVGPHPLGGLRFAVWDREQGNYVEQRVDLPEGTIISAHLNALITMMFQSIYAQHAQQLERVQSGLIVPGQ